MLIRQRTFYSSPRREIYCQRAPNFGKGTYNADGNSCKITYTVSTDDDEAAQDFCDTQHAVSLKSFSSGKTTTCEIASEMECFESEVLIGETCFLADADVPYDEAETKCKAQGSEYELHEVGSTFEQKWLATFYSQYRMLRVKNKEATLKNLILSELPAGQALINERAQIAAVNTAPKGYVIILRKGSIIGLKTGSLAPMTDHTRIGVLCSRRAKPRQEYLIALASRMEEVGFKVSMMKDTIGNDRPFTILRGLHSWIVNSDYDAGTNRFHEACGAFQDGYAATPLDFQRPNDLKKVLKDAGVNIVAMPGRKRSSAAVANYPDCKRDPDFSNARKAFAFDIKRVDGSTFEKTASKDELWKAGHPDRMCADMPRVGLAYSQAGLVDVPNTARLFVACTFGAPPAVRPDDGSEICDPLATFHYGSKSCECANRWYPDVKDQKLFTGLPAWPDLKPGLKCMNCWSAHGMDVVFLLHQSDSSTGEFSYCITKCLTFPMAYYEAAVRVIVLGGYGIVWDVGFQQQWGTPKTNDDAFGTGKFLKEKPGQLLLHEGFRRAYTSLATRPSRRKMIIMLLQDVPSDIDNVMSTYKTERSKLEGSVEIFVATYKQTDSKQLRDLSSTGTVFKVYGHSYQDSCNMATRISDVLLRLHCTL